MTVGKITTVALSGVAMALMLSGMFAGANLRTVKVTGFDEFEVHGKCSHTHRRALTDAGPLRFPNDNEWGSYDDRMAMCAQLKAGCRYALMVSREPNDRQASLGNYNFIFRGNRELHVGRIDKVVRMIDCTG
jgi:hypothetical protein